jgi:hypothetical protein
LLWEGGRRQRTIPLGSGTNVATFSLAPGFSKFEAFCVEADLLDHIGNPMAIPSGIISDDEDDDDADSVNSDARDASETEPWANASTRATPPANGEDQLKAAATPVEFNLNGPTTSASEGGKATSTSTINVITDKEDRQPSDLAELLMLHHQYGHISMRKMQEMANQGTIPKRPATCRIPTCSACLYSKATKRPWRGKESKQGDGREVPTQPGQVVSVDQLVYRR